MAMGNESDHSLWQRRHCALHHLRFLFSPTSGVLWKHFGWAILFWSKKIIHLALLKTTKKMWCCFVWAGFYLFLEDRKKWRSKWWQVLISLKKIEEMMAFKQKILSVTKITPLNFGKQSEGLSRFAIQGQIHCFSLPCCHSKWPLGWETPQMTHDTSPKTNMDTPKWWFRRWTPLHFWPCLVSMLDLCGVILAAIKWTNTSKHPKTSTPHFAHSSAFFLGLAQTS